MNNNVVSLPFDDLAEIDAAQATENQKKDILEFIGEVYEWCSKRGIDTTTNEFKHQVAVIMTQLQIILMGNKKD